MCTPELKFKEKMTTYPSDQSWAQFTKVFEIKSTNPRIKFAADEEIIDGISWKGKVLCKQYGNWEAYKKHCCLPSGVPGSPSGSSRWQRGQVCQ